VAEGRWLTDIDMRYQSNACVLGSSLAQTLFPFENPMDETVLVGADDRFRVVGVLQYQGRAAGPQGTTYDECVFVARPSSRRRFGDSIRTSSLGSSSNERVELHEIKVRLDSTDEVESAARILRDMIAPAHESKGDVEVT